MRQRDDKVRSDVRRRDDMADRSTQNAKFAETTDRAVSSAARAIERDINASLNRFKLPHIA